MRLSYLFLAPVAFVGFTFTAVAAPISGQLSFGGFAQAVGSVGFGSATGIDFANSTGTSVTGTSGVLSSDGAGSGTFATLGSCAKISGCGTILDIASFATESATSSFLTFTTGGPGVDFDLSNIISVSHSTSADSLTFIALGTINFSGLDATPGELILTAQGDNIVAYSGTLIATQPTAPTPEPGSVVLLGTGLLTAVGAMRRRLVA